MSTGHLSFVRSMWQQLPRSKPGQQPGTVGRGPSQSGHRRRSISSLRSLQFAAWSLAAPLAGVQGGRRPPCSGCVVVSPASVALAWRPLHARRARSFMISTLRSQVGFAAAVAHAHLRVHSQLTYPGIKDRDPCAFRAWRVVP